MTVSAIVCAYNEARLLPACLYSLLAQTRPPDEILVVDNASTDGTAAAARAVPHVRVIEEPRKGLVIARETARREAAGDLLAYIDADCRAPCSGSNCEKSWESIAQALRANVDIALMLYRNGSWAA